MNSEDRIPKLKDTLNRVAEIATLLEPSGISIRLLNYDGDSHFDSLASMSDITRKINSVDFDGCTRLGNVLDSKIIQPLIIQKARSGTLRKPVVVVVIPDGEVSPINQISHEYPKHSMAPLFSLPSAPVF